MAFQIQNGNNDDNGDIAEINIIPLVDVMLVLLIIFMVTAPLSIGGINVDLPFSKARSGAIDEKRVVLTVTPEGEFFIDKLKISESSLQEKMKSLYQFRDKKELYIRADRRTNYGKVIDVMSAAKIAGVTKISMLTQPPTKG
jgi:biopolymer transport protein TolR